MFTDVSEERTSKGEAEQLLRLLVACVANIFTLKIEAVWSSETSVIYRTARRYIPEDSFFSPPRNTASLPYRRRVRSKLR
jgi:hypothetical protein